MGMQARLSLWGMLAYDSSLLDNMYLPDDFTDDDKGILFQNLAVECADLEVLYSDWDFLKMAIEAWSAKEVVTWERLYKLATTEYNPLENYNRTENLIDQHSGALTNSGTDSVASTGYDSDVSSGNIANAHTGTDTTTKSKTAFESGTLATIEQDALLHGETVTETFNNMTVTHNKGTTDTITHGKTETDSRKIKRDIKAFGNIGVTTSQQMAEQELEVSPKLNIFNIIIESFKNRFCLLVY